MRRLRQMQARGGAGGGPPKVPRGAGGAMIGGALLAGGAWVLSNSLFNVDGGHRAIKYRRVSGVSKEIYSEGKGNRTVGIHPAGDMDLFANGGWKRRQALTSTSPGSKLPSSTTCGPSPETWPR